MPAKLVGVEPGALLECVVDAWIDEEGFPPVVEASITDSAGQRWVFHDEVPIFDAPASLIPGVELPVAAGIRVRITQDGDPVRVSTAPDGVESIDGCSEFVVPARALRPLPTGERHG